MPNKYFKVNLAYSDSTFTPEELLSDWISVSGVILTTSLLFYHMSRVKSLKVNNFLAKFVAIGLIVISTIYLIYALIPYIKRMNFAISECERLKDCSNSQVENIKFIKNSYLLLTSISIIIQCIIVYIVITTI